MDKPNTVLGEEDLGIANAQNFTQTLFNAFDTGDGIIVDLSQTQHIDTAIAQLLCIFNRDAHGRNVELNWRFSDAVTNILKILGLERHVQNNIP